MKTIIPLVFILNGLIFLLIACVFFPHIMKFLEEMRVGMNLHVPPFWNLAVVGQVVRVIFAAVGFFITVFGIMLLVFRNRIDWF